MNYKNILNLKPSMPQYKKLQFREVSSNQVRKIIHVLSKKKSAISSCIPVVHLTESVDIYLPFLTNITNQQSVFQKWYISWWA